jgi:hypothetical protein
MHLRAAVSWLGCLVLSGCAASNGGGPLRHLLTADAPGPLVRVATTDPAGHNHDYVSVPSGQTITLLDTSGPGLVRHIWMTVRPRERPEVLRGLVLRIYWDDERAPSVEAPIGDFFGVGFGERAEISSLLVTQLSGGMNCFWPMPFRRRAVITVTNHGPLPVEALYAHVDLTRPAAISAEEPTFHARWHRARTAAETPYVLLDTHGAGVYVGTVLSMQNLENRSLLFLEGNDAFQVDDEPRPSIVGTGTEDYFLSGWYFDRGPFSAWTYGASIVDAARGRASAFRWHVADGIPYRSHLRVTMQDGLAFSPTGHGPNADYSSVAFYYAREPHPSPSAISTWADVQPVEVAAPPTASPGTSEAEDLIGDGSVSRGAFQIERIGALTGPTFSSNGYVAWSGAERDAELVLPLRVPAAGTYRVDAWIGQAGDGVIADVSLDDARLGVLTFFRPGGPLPVVPMGPVDLGVARLAAGRHELRLKVTGTDPRMTLSDRFVYLDAVRLRTLARGATAPR